MHRFGARASLLLIPWLLAACAPVFGVGGTATESVVLPNGEVCGFVGDGATLTFDGQRLDWTCDVSATGPRGLFGGPTVVRDVDVYWRLGTAARRADGAGFELAAIEAVEARVQRLELASGETCAFAGEGATLAFAGRRANYTCDGDVVLVGGFTADALGLFATRGTVALRDGAFEFRGERVVRVRVVSLLPGVDVQRPPSPEVAHAPLLGTTWALERIQFADGREILVEDPSRYTLALAADGSAALRADCNRGAGRFDLDDARLTFAPFATTRAACAADTIDQTFLTQLGSVGGYRFDDGRLVLVSAIDGTQLLFRALD